MNYGKQRTKRHDTTKGCQTFVFPIICFFNSLGYDHRDLFNRFSQVAGKLILTQREGTPSAKNHEQHGVSVTNDGRLVVGQIADAEDILGKQALEQYEATRSIPLQFHDEILSASFPEMVILSMPRIIFPYCRILTTTAKDDE